MISIQGSPSRWCDGISRRDFLQIGGLGAAGLALPELFRARVAAPAVRGAGRIVLPSKPWRRYSTSRIGQGADALHQLEKRVQIHQGIRARLLVQANRIRSGGG